MILDTTKSLPADPAESAPSSPRTVWGLDPMQLHDCFWASQGVQVVRRGEESLIPDGRYLFLLIDARVLSIFDAGPALRALARARSEVLYVRLHEAHEHGYRERVVTDADQRFVKFERLYHRPSGRLARVAFTTEARVARHWQQSDDPITAWRTMRRDIPSSRRATLSVEGNLYDRAEPADIARFTRDLVRAWVRPDSIIRRAQRVVGDVWADPDVTVDQTSRFAGPVWIGAGRTVGANVTVIGPSVMWDDPSTARDATEPWKQPLSFEAIMGRPADGRANFVPIHRRGSGSPGRRTRGGQAGKRLFDWVCALVAVLITLPLYPIIILAVWLDDGFPIFFAHERETIGGRKFPCLKFRSMRRDAEKIKLDLARLNQADGPQFFMERDPRLTRVGRFLRKYRLDELPQFFNVLLGDMSIVGPRPSPFSENQYCPPWRDARLSVRPGITGLWQVNRTRRAGSDFQEWIRYDIEYVENADWKMDLQIIWKTILIMLRIRK